MNHNPIRRQFPDASVPRSILIVKMHNWSRTTLSDHQSLQYPISTHVVIATRFNSVCSVSVGGVSVPFLSCLDCAVSTKDAWSSCPSLNWYVRNSVLAQPVPVSFISLTIFAKQKSHSTLVFVGISPVFCEEMQKPAMRYHYNLLFWSDL